MTFRVFYNDMNAAKLQGIPIDISQPPDNSVLFFNGTRWVANPNTAGNILLPPSDSPQIVDGDTILPRTDNAGIYLLNTQVPVGNTTIFGNVGTITLGENGYNGQLLYLIVDLDSDPSVVPPNYVPSDPPQFCTINFVPGVGVNTVGWSQLTFQLRGQSAVLYYDSTGVGGYIGWYIMSISRGAGALP